MLFVVFCILVLTHSLFQFKDQKLKISQKLVEYGIDLYDCTGDSTQDRQQEILNWLKAHRGDISNWIAIDDIPLERGKYKTQFLGHTVTTNPRQGFTQTDFELACELFNVKP